MTKVIHATLFLLLSMSSFLQAHGATAQDEEAPAGALEDAEDAALDVATPAPQQSEESSENSVAVTTEDAEAPVVTAVEIVEPEQEVAAFSVRQPIPQRLAIPPTPSDQRMRRFKMFSGAMGVTSLLGGMGSTIFPFVSDDAFLSTESIIGKIGVSALFLANAFVTPLVVTAIGDKNGGKGSYLGSMLGALIGTGLGFGLLALADAAESSGMYVVSGIGMPIFQVIGATAGYALSHRKAVERERKIAFTGTGFAMSF